MTAVPKPQRVRDPDYLDWIRTRPCLLFLLPGGGCTWGDSDPAHVKSRGAGGGDDTVVPLCRKHHREQHQLGVKSFERKYGLDLQGEARRLRAAWLR